MIPKWVAVMFFGTPLAATWIFKLLMEPHLVLQLTQHQVWIRHGEMGMLGMLTLLYIVVSILILLWRDDTKKVRKDASP